MSARVLTSILSLLVFGCAHSTVPTPRLPLVRLQAAHADQLLQPGDFLFRVVDPRDPLVSQMSGVVIEGGQVAIQATTDAVRSSEHAVQDLLGQSHERFESALSDGDPNAVHMAIYLGEGLTAEAFGTNLDDPRVAVWPLFADYRRPAAWRVMRHRDREVRASVAAVARRWASGRMGYRLPLDVFAQDAAWGEHGRRNALVFAAAFDQAGGPESFDGMFCSQFAVAVLQSASARALGLALDGENEPTQMDALPSEARIDSVASPLRVYSEWSRSGAFLQVAEIVIE